MDTGNTHYPEFEYAAAQLSAFSSSVGTFVISLKGGPIVHFTPMDTERFKKWLLFHGVRDISVDIGIPSRTKTKGQ